jgi:hypothetical protein
MTSPAQKTSMECSKHMSHRSSKPSLPCKQQNRQPNNFVGSGSDDNQSTQHGNVVHIRRALGNEENHPTKRPIKRAEGERSFTTTMSHTQSYSSGLSDGISRNKVIAVPKFYAHSRPWQEAAGPAVMSVTGVSPMERWEREAIKEQPWNKVSGVYVHGGLPIDAVPERGDSVQANASVDSVSEGCC